MNYIVETIFLKDQEINLAVPKDFDVLKKYSVYLVFDGKDLLTKVETNILSSNNSNKIYIGINNPNDVIRFNQFSTYRNYLVKQLMIAKFPELKNQPNDYLGGDGQSLINFIEQDLLPWIKNNKKIQINNLNLLGCSMGGYFSLQLLYLSNLTFNKALLFSPSIWFNQDIINRLQTQTLNKNMNLTVNLWVGLKEPKLFEKNIVTNYLEDAKKLKEILISHQKINVNLTIEEDGSHGFKWWIAFLNHHQDWY